MVLNSEDGDYSKRRNVLRSPPYPLSGRFPRDRANVHEGASSRVRVTRRCLVRNGLCSVERRGGQDRSESMNSAQDDYVMSDVWTSTSTARPRLTNHTETDAKES